MTNLRLRRCLKRQRMIVCGKTMPSALIRISGDTLLERVAVGRMRVFSEWSEAAFAQQMRSGHPLNAIDCNTL